MLGLTFLFFNTISEATIGTLPLTIQHLCDLQDANPRNCFPGAGTLTSKSAGLNVVVLKTGLDELFV